ncbi:MAG: ADP-ribosyltransferase [Lachnospiraceae bacterium]|nr:ADP-ribosyltransferase [Lachnospiraceae bacterium]
MTDYNPDDAPTLAQLNRTLEMLNRLSDANKDQDPDPTPQRVARQHRRRERTDTPVDRAFKAVWGEDAEESLHKKALDYSLQNEVQTDESDNPLAVMGRNVVDSEVRNMTLFNSGRTEKSRRSYLSKASKEFEEASFKLEDLRDEKESIAAAQIAATTQEEKDALKARVMQSIAESESAIDLIIQAKEHEYKGYKSSKEDKANAAKLQTQRATMLMNLYREECKNPLLSGKDKEMLMQKAQKLQVYKDTTMTRLAVMDGRLLDTYEQYHELSSDAIFTMSEQNSYNTDKTYREIVYSVYSGEFCEPGCPFGYISTPNGAVVNKYVRLLQDRQKARDMEFSDPAGAAALMAKLDEKEKALNAEIYDTMVLLDYDGEAEIYDVDQVVSAWKTKVKETVKHMDAATKENRLTQNTRLYRMVDKDILNWGFGLDPNVTKDMPKESLVDSLNQQAGTELQEAGYMSTGWSVDEQFSDRPVMLTILADEGQRCFVTKNFKEGEIIFGRNTRYVFMGAVNHETDKKKVKQTRRDTPDDAAGGKDLESKDEGTFSGIELIVKIVRDDAAA